MPRRLPERFLPHTINEFRAASFERHLDALALAENGRRSGAIYLWGYVAEMLLKAAVFSVWGYDRTDPIFLKDVQAASQLAPTVGLHWNGGLHNISAWAELLVRYRASLPGLAYASQRFGIQVIAHSRRLHQTWRETLRYHKNVAYLNEVRDVRSDVEWLLDCADEL